MCVYFLKQKRASALSGPRMVILTIASFLLGVLISFLFISVGKEYATGEIFQKMYVARELALINDALYSVPGNAIMTYKEDVGNYFINIGSGWVIVDPEEDTEVRYAYGQDREDIDAFFSELDTIFITKQSGKIYYSEGQEDFKNTPSCSRHNVVLENILLVSSDNKDAVIADPEENAISVSEKSYTEETSEYLFGLFSRDEINARMIDGSTIFESDYRNLAENYDLTIVLRFGSQNDFMSNEVYVYSGGDETRNLACNIAESAGELDYVTKSALKFVDRSRISEESELYPMSYGTNVIVLELGNINSQYSDNLYFRYGEVAEKIYKAVMGESGERN